MNRASAAPLAVCSRFWQRRDRRLGRERLGRRRLARRPRLARTGWGWGVTSAPVQFGVAFGLDWSDPAATFTNSINLCYINWLDKLRRAALSLTHAPQQACVGAPVWCNMQLRPEVVLTGARPPQQVVAHRTRKILYECAVKKSRCS